MHSFPHTTNPCSISQANVAKSWIESDLGLVVTIPEGTMPLNPLAHPQSSRNHTILQVAQTVREDRDEHPWSSGNNLADEESPEMAPLVDNLRKELGTNISKEAEKLSKRVESVLHEGFHTSWGR